MKQCHIMVQDLISHVKPVFKCRNDLNKELFKHSRCLLTISVGQEVHESDKFYATIDLVNKSFASCVMLIDDSLQRHTMALNSKKNADFFYKFSLEQGDLWLKRNYQYYKKLTKLESIIRWDKWLKHSDYFKQETTIKGLLEKDPAYKGAFEKTIQEFLRRYYQRLIVQSNFDINRAQKLCFDYLIEENVALALWPELNCHFEVYPSQRNLAMNETHKRFVVPNYPDLLHAVAIKFKNRKQLKPQILNYCQGKENLIA